MILLIIISFWTLLNFLEKSFPENKTLLNKLFFSHFLNKN
jgi:hypothetical protein